MRAWILGAAMVAALSRCSCQPAPAGCPQGQTRQDGKCVTACAPQNQCGAACCAAGDTCLSSGNCAHPARCNDSSECTGGTSCIGNICVDANAQCTFKPPPGPFTPRIAWKWTGSSYLPQYDNVLMTPVVIPLTRGNGDGFAAPAVVFNSILDFQGAGQEVPGVIRAVSGRDGTELWTSDPAHLVNGLTGIAAGDLFGDGRVEFVTGRLPNGVPADQGVVAFDNQGHFLWEVKGISVGWGAPSIANFFGGAEASVLIGSTLIDAHGHIVCSAQPSADGTPAGTGSNFMGPISTVADVDLDGIPDIVTGSAIYGRDCKPKPGWPNGQPDGLVAVADFTGDAHPEIVVVSGGKVRLQDWTGKVIWGPVTLPYNCVNGLVPGSGEPCTPGGGGGAPTIADFDGDGKLEIGVAGNSTYTVLKPFAATPILWTRPTQDTSKVTGSSVFDFEHDGRAEVVYGDECYTRVFSGPTGDTLFEAPNPSCTVHENPVIADVDRDGRAEIVVATNRVCGNAKCPWGSHGDSDLHGVTVYKDLRDHWVGTRSIWNQHAYHVTNVNDDGSIPFPEPDNWRVPGLNDFRMNPIGNPDYSAPDLTADPATDVSLDLSSCPGSLRITVNVWNRGAVIVTAGVPITFRQGGASGVVLAVAYTQGAILPGSSEAVSVTLSPAPATPVDVTILLNQDETGQGVVGECNTANNIIPVYGVFCPAVGK